MHKKWRGIGRWDGRKTGYGKKKDSPEKFSGLSEFSFQKTFRK